MTAGDVALALFTAFNTLRVLAYLPQIVCIAKDTGGAAAISYTTWGLFGASHLSTAAYAALSVHDWTMALIFGANTACCVVIIAATAMQRRRFRWCHGAGRNPRPGVTHDAVRAPDLV